MVIKYLLYALLVLFLMGCSRVVDYDHVNSVNVLAYLEVKYEDEQGVVHSGFLKRDSLNFVDNE